MFLKKTSSGYKQDGQQFCHGLFLMICQNKDSGRRLWGCVRKVKMEQLGHWMMATVELGGKKMVLSGTYGSDGLPMSLDSSRVSTEEGQKLLDQMVELPPDLVDTFWKGGGHNCAGPEAPAIAAWAKQNLKVLQKPIRKI